MKKLWNEQTPFNKRIFVGVFTFILVLVTIFPIKPPLMFPGVLFASFALPFVPLLPEHITNNIGNTGIVIYMAIICGLFAATFATPINSFKLRMLRNILISPFIIFGVFFSILSLSGGGYMGPA